MQQNVSTGIRSGIGRGVTSSSGIGNGVNKVYQNQSASTMMQQTHSAGFNQTGMNDITGTTMAEQNKRKQ